MGFFSDFQIIPFFIEMVFYSLFTFKMQLLRPVFCQSILNR